MGKTGKFSGASLFGVGRSFENRSLSVPPTVGVRQWKNGMRGLLWQVIKSSKSEPLGVYNPFVSLFRTKIWKNDFRKNNLDLVTGVDCWNDFVVGPIAVLVVWNIVGRCHDAVVGWNRGSRLMWSRLMLSRLMWSRLMGSRLMLSASFWKFGQPSRFSQICCKIKFPENFWHHLPP